MSIKKSICYTVHICYIVHIQNSQSPTAYSHGLQAALQTQHSLENRGRSLVELWQPK